MNREQVESVVMAWCPLPEPLLIAVATARNLVSAAGGWFSCPEGVFLVVEQADYLLAQLRDRDEKLVAVVEQAGGALEIAANDLEALDAGVEVTERGDAAPWVRARKAIDGLYRILHPKEK